MVPEMNDEPGTLSRPSLRHDAAAMPLGYLAADGQPDARSLIVAPGVQALEHLEDLLGVLRLEADPVVLHDDPQRAVPGHRAVHADVDHGRPVRHTEFQSVADEVLE